MTEDRGAGLVVREGVCHAVFVFDVGLWVDLEKCRRLLAEFREDTKLRQNRGAPKYFDYHPAPLRLTDEVEPVAVAGFTSEARIDVVLYDFGSIAVTYAIPFRGPLGRVRDLSCGLLQGDALAQQARRRVEGLVDRVRSAVGRPSTSGLVEDYAVFQVRELETPCRPEDLYGKHGGDVAQILRAETLPLSEQEVADALACRIAYEKDDLTLIDWNAALIYDREADDVRAVLEFANAELLEVRFLDRELDASLDKAYESLSVRRWRLHRGGGRPASLKIVGQMQVDGAILFERVSNALKLLGDQYLARVYRLASQRFHLAEWNAGILRKLDAIESIYEKISDRNANRRIEILEWIIIVLIAFEIVLPFTQKWFGL
jgi:hypothetical protein